MGAIVFDYPAINAILERRRSDDAERRYLAGVDLAAPNGDSAAVVMVDCARELGIAIARAHAMRMRSVIKDVDPRPYHRPSLVERAERDYWGDIRVR